MFFQKQTDPFESYVILTTAKTLDYLNNITTKFESYVILTTAKTRRKTMTINLQFESYVILTTAKTDGKNKLGKGGLANERKKSQKRRNNV